MSGYPPPDELVDEIKGETCWWSEDNGPCDQPAVTTRYDGYARQWIPVCDEHRRIR